jgi:hypothetical protein
MSSNAHAGEEHSTDAAGGHTDLHLTGGPETGTFTTDEAPTADTPSHGSSNAGINKTGANRTDVAEE